MDAVFHRLAIRGDRGGDERHTGRHRLENDIRETLRMAQQHGYVERSVQPHGVAPESVNVTSRPIPR